MSTPPLPPPPPERLPPSEGGRKRSVLLATGFYTHERHAGIARYAREAHWLLDCRLIAFRATGAKHLSYLSGTRYDGIIAYSSLSTPWIRQLVRGSGVPVVELGMDCPEDRFPRVLTDNLAVGRTGAEHLLERGFTELLFYSYSYDTFATRTRLEGFRARAERAGARFHRLIWDERPRAARKQPRLHWLAEHLRGLPAPLAVMALNDHVAAELLEACELAGLRVPEQVAVLGADNDPLVTNLTSIPISSVDTSRERVGYEAAALLDRLMSGAVPAPREPVLIPPAGVVTRKSTDVLAVKDTDVAIAIHYIWGHYREPIGVEDVAAQTSVSRRRLQDLFLRHVGHAIIDEITRRRVSHARELLTRTPTKVRLIAAQCGFSSAERLSKVFQRVAGMSPLAYRERYRTDSVPEPLDADA